MRVPDPFIWLGEHVAMELPGARAIFTTRRGGVSEGPYSSLNLGLATNDEQDRVKRNRELVQHDVGVRMVFTRQVHGSVVEVVGGPERGGGEVLADIASVPRREADGQVTATPGVGPSVLTADCLPIALASGSAVAMVHAGWRGLAGGVVSSAVDAMRRLDGDGAIHAAIGPGAGACCYEVGPEVHAAFGRLQVGHATIDLKALARDALVAAGVARVDDCGLCTICAGRDLFFSHRRDRGVTGRQAGIAWLC